MFQSGISVVICCYNSEIRLPETLKHIAMQQIAAEILWEVVIINNVSTDHTAEIAKIEWEKYNVSDVGFRVINEPKSGVQNARERGVQSALYNYVLFCDDDNWLNPNYVDLAYKIISIDPTIGALGGQSKGVSNIDLPLWFEESQTNYAVGKQAPVSCDVTYRKHLWSSGIIIRKDLYMEAFKNFPYILGGRNGKNLGSGEDSEICMRFILMGYRLYYSEDLKFTHCIPKERLTTEYSNGLMNGFIEAHGMLTIYARLIDMRNLSFAKKYKPALKSAIRILLAKAFNLSRWDINIEKLNIYLSTNYKYSSIDENIISIKEFSNRAKYSYLNAVIIESKKRNV